jgi:hypothetical protein
MKVVGVRSDIVEAISIRYRWKRFQWIGFWWTRNSGFFVLSFKPSIKSWHFLHIFSWHCDHTTPKVSDVFTAEIVVSKNPAKNVITLSQQQFLISCDKIIKFHSGIPIYFGRPIFNIEMSCFEWQLPRNFTLKSSFIGFFHNFSRIKDIIYFHIWLSLGFGSEAAENLPLYLAALPLLFNFIISVNV